MSNPIIGRSAHTSRKYEALGAFDRMWFAIASRVRKRKTLRVIDPTAGDGRGSPIVHLDAARASGVLDWQLVCIERNRQVFDQLAARLGPNLDHGQGPWQQEFTAYPIELHYGDCCDVLPRLPSGFDPELVLIDPNGADFRIVDALGSVHRRCDVLLHVTATAAKRNGTERLDSAVGRLGKKYGAIWVDRMPDHNTGWQLSFVIATNFERLLTSFKQSPDYHFADLRTEEGKALLNHVSRTANELKEQRWPRLI